MTPWTIYVMGIAHGLALGCATLWVSYRVARRRLARRALPPSERGGGDG